jgi:tRNA (cmo5U34)-methyltransferase
VAVSASPPGAPWQRSELVASYLERRDALVPLLALQEDVVRRLLERHSHKVGRFLDLGAGDGGMSAVVFSVSAQAHGLLVDNSEPMLARVDERFAGTSFRWETMRADLDDPAWLAAVPAGSFDLVISGLAIHHLPTASKRRLYGQIHDLLAPRGLFVNMDYVAISGPLRGLFDEEWEKGLDHEHGEEAAEDDDDHDQPDPVEDQLAWLREAGFTDIEIHFKWAEAAIFGGMRPEGASS